MMECGIRWAVEARRKGRGAEKEQRRQEEQEQQRRGEPLEEMRTESTDEPEVTGRFAEVKTGGGSASLVQGGADGHDELDETRSKGKGKGNGGKREHGGNGDKGGKGFQQSVKMMKGEEEQETAEEDEGRVRMAPNMGAGGSHPQATTDPEEKQRQGGQWVLRPTREWQNELSLVGKWAVCVDEEPEEEAEEEEVKGEEGAGQEEEIGEKPPGLEEVKSKQEAQEKEKQSQVKSEQEAREDERRAQEAREDKERRTQKA